MNLSHRIILVYLSAFPFLALTDQPGKIIKIIHAGNETTETIMARKTATKEESTQKQKVLLHPIDRSHIKHFSNTIHKQLIKKNIRKLAGIKAPIAKNIALNFLGATSDETPFFPPDSMGAVGPSQYILIINGILRSFNKSTGKQDNVLDTSLNNFFNSVRNNFSVGDSRIRYDFFSKRWFIITINFDLPNRVIFAVSNNSIITQNTGWTLFFFEQNNIIADTFADYPTLGIDKNALYIGANIFNANDFFENTEAIVIPKAPILSGDPITGFAFANLINAQGRGLYTPQGVDNFDSSTNVGYFIGVDASFFDILVLRRISNPGTTPTISKNIFLHVPPTSLPLLVPHKDNNRSARGRLDAIDDRLMNAMISNNRLWTIHNIAVNNTGQATNANSRNGCRWYEINVASTTPTLVQSGTLLKRSDTNDTTRFFWMPSIMVNGQGHALIGCSTAGQKAFANAAIAARLASTPQGKLQGRSFYTESTTAYNPSFDPGSSRGRRWGDYSNVSLDVDKMTWWTIQEYCSDTNEFGVRIAKILAPPPATPSSVSPSMIAKGQSSVALSIFGTSHDGSGFFDPGSNLFKRLNVQIGNGVTVKSISFVNPTRVNAVVSTVGATKGSTTVRIINPDSQSKATSGLLTIT